jgi:hypothetical protein
MQDSVAAKVIPDCAPKSLNIRLIVPIRGTDATEWPTRTGIALRREIGGLPTYLDP